MCAINYKRGSAVQIAEETQTAAAALARSANLRREVQCECVFVRMQGCDLQMSPTTSKARASPSKAQKVSLNGHWDQFACASDKTRRLFSHSSPFRGKVPFLFLGLFKLPERGSRHLYWVWVLRGAMHFSFQNSAAADVINAPVNWARTEKGRPSPLLKLQMRCKREWNWADNLFDALFSARHIRSAFVFASAFFVAPGKFISVYTFIVCWRATLQLIWGRFHLRVRCTLMFIPATYLSWRVARIDFCCCNQQLVRGASILKKALVC